MRVSLPPTLVLGSFARKKPRLKTGMKRKYWAIVMRSIPFMKAMNIFPFNPISYYSFTETYINTPKSLLAADSKTHRISLLRHMATVRRQYDSFPFLLMRLPRQWTAFARTLIE